MTKLNMDDVLRKVRAGWRKWNDSAVSPAEKEVIRKTIEKYLKKYGLSMDWKTGNVTQKASKQEGKQEASKQAGKQEDAFTTKDLIEILAHVYKQTWTGKNLRRKIRQMEKWNDGKVTHYRFTDLDIDEILQHIGINDNSWREVYMRKQA